MLNDDYDVVDAICRYEEGEMATEAEEVELFRYLIKTGMIHHLQGTYGRTARDLQERGLLNETD